MRAASIGPSSEALSQGCTTAQVMGSSALQRAKSGAKPSLRRRISSGVATLEYWMRSVGAVTISDPSTSTSPAWFTQRQSNSIAWSRLCLAFATTLAVSVSPMLMMPE